MQFIPEAIIDKYYQGISDLDVSTLQSKHPVIFAYIFSDTFHFLTEEEKNYFLFLCNILLRSVHELHSEFSPLKEAFVESAEEKNWELLDKSKDNRFRERITIFFENFPQEDLLAFIEDALIHDDEGENPVSKEGRDLVFIGLKTVLDCLMASAK